MKDGPVSFSTVIRQRRTLLVAFWLGYLALAGGYLLLVSRQSVVWQLKRQKLIEESPVVWVAPFGIHYHREKHYGNHLSSPITLYEATERGYEYCNICQPPPPAQLLQLPVWIRHWLLILLTSSGPLLIVSLVVLYKTRGGSPQALPED